MVIAGLAAGLDNWAYTLFSSPGGASILLFTSLAGLAAGSVFPDLLVPYRRGFGRPCGRRWLCLFGFCTFELSTCYAIPCGCVGIHNMRRRLVCKTSACLKRGFYLVISVSFHGYGVVSVCKFGILTFRCVLTILNSLCIYAGVRAGVRSFSEIFRGQRLGSWVYLDWAILVV